MPKIQISVCTNCKQVSCDGAMWRIVKVIRLQDGKDETDEMLEENKESCSMNMFGRGREPDSAKVGHRFTKEYLNWVNPSAVTLEKIAD